MVRWYHLGRRRWAVGQRPPPSGRADRPTSVLWPDTGTAAAQPELAASIGCISCPAAEPHQHPLAAWRSCGRHLRTGSNIMSIQQSTYMCRGLRQTRLTSGQRVQHPSLIPDQQHRDWSLQHHWRTEQRSWSMFSRTGSVCACGSSSHQHVWGGHRPAADPEPEDESGGFPPGPSPAEHTDLTCWRTWVKTIEPPGFRRLDQSWRVLGLGHTADSTSQAQVCASKQSNEGLQMSVLRFKALVLPLLKQCWFGPTCFYPVSIFRFGVQGMVSWWRWECWCTAFSCLLLCFLLFD